MLLLMSAKNQRDVARTYLESWRTYIKYSFLNPQYC